MPTLNSFIAQQLVKISKFHIKAKSKLGYMELGTGPS